MTWMEVPDRALVAVHSSSRDATWFAYRYGSRGRWLYHNKIWDPGRLCWQWDQMHDDARCGDFVVIDSVSPNQTVEWFADKCKTPCGPHGGRSALSAIEFERGNRITWDDVRPGMVIQLKSGAVGYRLNTDGGAWVRYPPGKSGWREVGSKWSWSGIKGWLNGEFNVAVMATGVEATDAAIRVAVGGESTVLTIPEWAVKP